MLFKFQGYDCEWFLLHILKISSPEKYFSLPSFEQGLHVLLELNSIHLGYPHRLIQADLVTYPILTIFLE